MVPWRPRRWDCMVGAMETNLSMLEEEIGAALRDLGHNLSSVAQGGGDAGQIADQARNVAYLLGDFRALEGVDPNPEVLAASLRYLEKRSGE